MTRWIGSALFAFLLVACGGGGGTPPSQGNVGPDGATVSSADQKATLVVPAGAVNGTIDVTLAPATDGYLADPLIVPGTVYKVDAPDTALTQAASLSLAVPDGLAAAAAGDRKRTLATVVPLGLLGCYVHDRTSDPDRYIPLPAPEGTDIPPNTDPTRTFATVCVYDGYIYKYPNDCPAGFVNVAGGLWNDPSYFTPTAPGTIPFGSDSGVGQVSVCEAAPVPAPAVASLSATAAASLLPTLVDLPTHRASVSLSHLGPGIFAIVYDHTLPVVHLTSATTVIPTGPGMAKVRLVADASDNVAVTRVSFVKWGTAGSPSMITKTDLASFTSPPYSWESAPMALSELYNQSYLATAEDAAGNLRTTSLYLAQTTPVVASFTASPATVPYGGGDVTLSWSIPPVTDYATYPDTLNIDQGVGDVTGLTSKTVHVTAPTTFTLTATNTAGSVTSVATVAVGPEPAPTIVSFTATPSTLPATGGTVTLAWATSGAGTLTILPGVGDVTALTSKTVSVTAHTTFTLQATNGSGTVTQTAEVFVAASGDRFVDVAGGSDANDCSAPTPCKTIAKAASGAPSGATVYLADGLYDTPTQTTVTLPDGVTLRATHPGAATLAGFPVTAAGSAAVNGIVLDASGGTCASINAASASGTPTLTLSGVLIKCIGAVNIGGNVKATMTPGALPGGLYSVGLPGGYNGIVALSGTAELLVNDGIFDGNDVGATAYGGGFITATGASKLTLDHATVRNRKGIGLSVSGTAAAVLRNNALIDKVGAAGNCQTAASILLATPASLTLDHAQVSNSPNIAICIAGAAPAATVVLTSATLSNNASGIATPAAGFATATLTATATSLTGNSSGIYFMDAGGSHFDLSGLTVTGNSDGIVIAAAAGSTFKLRGSTVSSNSHNGVFLYYNPIDLGTSADPGGNTITGNSNTGLQANLDAGKTCNAVGNTWIASQQGADAGGHYSTAPAWTQVPESGPISGKNFNIPNAATLNL